MIRYFCNCIPKTPKTTTPEKYLETVAYSNTIPFIPPIASGKVIKVYDGDTITIASKLPYDNSPVYRFSVRLLGIDSPEIKSKTSTEKQLAIQSKDALSNLIMDKIVHLKNISTEKYGRVLANVYLDDLHVNNWLLDNNHAIPYDGGTKNRPSEWDGCNLGIHQPISISFV